MPNTSFVDPNIASKTNFTFSWFLKRITERARELDLKTEQIPYEERDHALYIAYGPYENPRYAVSIIIEHGGSGSSAAAPIAKKLFKLVIDRHEIREKIKQKEFQTI